MQTSLRNGGSSAKTLGNRVTEKAQTGKHTEPKILTEMARKQSDEVSVEDEAYGDTDENIVRSGNLSTSLVALK